MEDTVYISILEKASSLGALAQMDAVGGTMECFIIPYVSILGAAALHR